DLVMREVACDKSGALEWLADQGFIAAAEPRQERRDAPPAPEVPPEDERPPQGSAEPEGKMVAVKGYHYTDGDGNLLYDVIRYQKQLPDGSWVLSKSGTPWKTFRQRRPDGRGGHIWNLDGIAHTIYRRPEVEIAISEGKLIGLVEGEKDAD